MYYVILKIVEVRKDVHSGVYLQNDEFIVNWLMFLLMQLKMNLLNICLVSHFLGFPIHC